MGYKGFVKLDIIHLLYRVVKFFQKMYSAHYSSIIFSTCIAGEDYEAVAPTELTFDMSMGSDSLIGVDIIILDDSVLENRECFYVVISFSESCFVDPPMARVCIDDDDDDDDDSM